jgi:hypothetical protein
MNSTWLSLLICCLLNLWWMQIIVVGNRRSRTHLRWAWNGSQLELFTPIALNKNGQPSYKNVNVMIATTSL